ncbi:MAG: type II toxin-antitoxin system HicA family toxin [Ignavibacteriaceae bacterium]|jgi:predicted RNA binding protein YcfA (HicA-like mRNA interferase family)|nr:type II toxin-antitoxin system HicA family toxin [Ignavibacteriaceae bacterium]
MKLPRDFNADQLIKLLTKTGYDISRQSGSHIRLTTIMNGQHHITVPNHNPIKIGTLNNILKDVAEHFQITKEELLKRLLN